MIGNNAGTRRIEKTTELEQLPLSTIGLRKQEYELLRLISLRPLITQASLQLIYPDSMPDLERLRRRSLLAVSEKGEYALRRVGWSLLAAARALQSSEPTSAIA